MCNDDNDDEDEDEEVELEDKVEEIMDTDGDIRDSFDCFIALF